MIGAVHRRIVHIGGGGDASAVGGSGGDGAGVHQAHGGELTLAGLGALAVGEVAGGVPQAQAVVGGHIACAEAGAAEAGLDNRAGGQQIGRHAVAGQLQRHGHGGGVHVQRKRAVAGAAALENVRRLGDVVKQAAGAAGDDALIRPHAAVVDLVGKVGVGLWEALGGVGLHLGQQLLCVLQKFVDRPRVGGVEGQGDHGLDLAQIDGDHPVVIGHLCRMQGRVVLRPLVGGVEALGLLVRLPDGGKTGGLGGHHVHAVAEVDGQLTDAGTHELQYLIIHKAAFKGGLYQRDGHVVGANAPAGLAGEIHHHHLRHRRVPRVLQQLLGQLRAALAHGHGAQRAVTGVGVGAKDHGAALCHLLPGIGVDDALVGGYVDAAVLLGGGEAEHVVVLIDGAAHRTQAVVTVSQGVGDGELLHAAGSGLLDDAHIGNVVGHHGVKPDLKSLRIAGYIVALQDTPCHGALPRLLLGNVRLLTGNAVHQIHAVVRQLDHS